MKEYFISFSSQGLKKNIFYGVKNPEFLNLRPGFFPYETRCVSRAKKFNFTKTKNIIICTIQHPTLQEKLNIVQKSSNFQILINCLENSLFS